MRDLLLPVLALAACARGVEHPRSPAPFTEVLLATAPGLSGLAREEGGALWTLAERASTAYRITLDAQLTPTVETLAIEGVPAGLDLEAIAVLGDGTFAIGTEGSTSGVATIVRAERRGAALVVTTAVTVDEVTAGAPLTPNHGAEGLCGHGNTLLVALETAGTDRGRRWGPLVRIIDGAVVRSHRLWLASGTGKLSGLDCTIGADGTIHGWAIERHFEVTKLLAFTLPPDAPVAITPTEVIDVSPLLNSTTNLEGIVRLHDGRLVTVVDNQWKSLDGASRLIVFPARGTVSR